MLLRSLFMLLITVNALHASIISPLPAEEMLSEADLVVVGRLVSKHSYTQDFYIDHGPGEMLLTKDFLLTDWSIQVLETIKGKCPNATFPATWIGGRTDEREVSTSTDFHLAEGETALFFIDWMERNQKWFISGSSAVFVVEDYGGDNRLFTSGTVRQPGTFDNKGVEHVGHMLGVNALDDFEGRTPGCK